MSTNYDDCNLFGIKNEAERYIYGSWLTLVVISSLLGDTTILVASIKYKAFRLHRTVIVFIQHVAVCDLFTAVGMLLPVIVSLIYDSGGSNEIVKFIRFFIGYWVFSASPLLIGAMSVGKCYLVRYPLRAQNWSTMKTHKLCAGLWIISLTVPVQHLIIDMADVVFDCRTYMWNYRYSSEIWNTLMPITTVLAYLTPNIIIITATIVLLNGARRVANRMQQNLRWQGTMAVVITATIFTISFLPITVYFIAGPLLETDSEDPGPFFNRYYRVTEAVLFTNVMANFFTYGLTVASFRDFLKTKVIKKLPFLSTSTLSQLTPFQVERTRSTGFKLEESKAEVEMTEMALEESKAEVGMTGMVGEECKAEGMTLMGLESKSEVEMTGIVVERKAEVGMEVKMATEGAISQ